MAVLPWYYRVGSLGGVYDGLLESLLQGSSVKTIRFDGSGLSAHSRLSLETLCRGLSLDEGLPRPVFGIGGEGEGGGGGIERGLL